MKLLPILSPLFFRKIVEIEVFALWPAILDECELWMPTPSVPMKPIWSPIPVSSLSLQAYEKKWRTVNSVPFFF